MASSQAAGFTFKCQCGKVEIQFHAKPCMHTYDCCEDCTGAIRHCVEKGGPNHLAHEVGDDKKSGVVRVVYVTDDITVKKGGEHFEYYIQRLDYTERLLASCCYTTIGCTHPAYGDYLCYVNVAAVEDFDHKPVELLFPDDLSVAGLNAIPEHQSCAKLVPADLADFDNHLHGKIFNKAFAEKETYEYKGDTRLTDIIKELGKEKKNLIKTKADEEGGCACCTIS